MVSVPDGALNFRHPLPGLYRSGNLSRLTERGQAELLALGLGRIVDLRNRAEREVDAPPFLGRTEYLNLPLLPYRNQALNAASAVAAGNADFYRTYLEHAANHVTVVLGALLDAPPGPVLIHCHAGKDRTGLIAALCLELCGTPRGQIAGDYAASGLALVDFYAEWRRRKVPGAWAREAPFAVSRPVDILAALQYLDTQWNGLCAYLSAFGFSSREQGRLRARLLM
ncbi:tyrosine-protein phosphatase [Deinococcus hopiensis]|uniref:Protein tyrosine/serine phosphatase n=1 Tax=Deinococcus hopiensis KR-140 TaxID=695939 RepID=A0A1W1VGT0_9DEIO|nr:tyrosine-protein phosphatase [Deinococcus hopiensis]SMB92281.1 Protein tyrosine/serine phosphatase [Deinococcus hopiensis KR-140]